MAEPPRNGAAPAAGGGGFGNPVIEQYRALVERNPKDKAAMHSLLMAFMSQKAYREGISEFQRFTSADPRNAKAHLCLAILYEKGGYEDNAVREYQETIDLNGDEELAYQFLSTRQLRRGEYDLAIKTCRAGIVRYPKGERFNFNLGYALLLRQQYDEAITAFQKEIELNPQCNEAYLNIDIIRRTKAAQRPR